MSLFRVFSTFLAIAGTASFAAAADGLDRNFTIDEFNSIWVREGGPDAILKFDIDPFSISNAPSQDYDDRLIKLTKYNGKDADQDMANALTHSTWRGFLQSERATRERIEESPVLPNVLVGFNMACAESGKHPIDEATKFSLEYLSKRAFLTNRSPLLTSADLNSIKGFVDVSYSKNVNLSQVCKLLYDAYRSQKKTILTKLKTEIESTNRLHHQCGAPDEIDSRLKPPCKAPYFNDPNLANWIRPGCDSPSFYNLKKNERLIGGVGLDNRTQSTIECESYYRIMYEQKRDAADRLKQQNDHDTQLIKRALIETQSIK